MRHPTRSASTESDTLVGSGVRQADEDIESADELRMQMRKYISKYEDDWFNIFTTDDPQFQDT